MKKRIFLIVLSCAVLFCGCSSPAQLLRSWNNELPPSAGIVYRKSETALISERTFLSAAENMAVQFSAADDAENEKELFAAYAQDADITALCCQLSTDSDASALVKLAAGCDKPLVFFGQEPSAAILDSYDQCWYVGSREREAGELMGQIAADALQSGQFIDCNQNKLIEYVLFSGQADISLADVQGEAALSVLENTGYFSTCVEASDCAEDAQSAYEATLSLLDNDVPIELFLCPRAEEAEGVIRALEERGLLFSAAPPNTASSGDTRPLIPFLKYGVVCTEKSETVAALIARGAVLGCAYFDEHAAAAAILILARNASVRTNPSNGLSFIIEEHRRVYIPYLTETSK